MNKRLPHYKVYARLAVSEIHGVGVKAIRPIKKGQDIFYGNDNRSEWVDMRSIKWIPQWASDLYEDFSVEFGDHYGCPVSFNRLTPACYVNHSPKPNVAFDLERGFYALRDIKTNEELTANYNSFSKLYE